MSNWTEDDERRYSEMVKRRSKALYDSRTAFFVVTSRIWSQDMSRGMLVDRLIENVEFLREAVATYDRMFSPEKEQS